MKSYPADEFFDGRQLELARAIDRNDMNALRANAAGVDLSAAGRKEMTLLWYAMVGSGTPHLDAIKTLVSLGVDPDTQIAQGLGSALDYAFLSKETHILKAMLDGGLSPNHRSPKQKLMLQRAVAASLAHTKLLLERGTEIDAQDSIGGTALDASLTKDKPEIGLYLLQHGANFNTVTVNGVTPAWTIKWTLDRLQRSPLRTQFEELRDLMIAKGAKWPPDPPEVVRDWMRRQGMKVVVPAGHKK